ncbi:MAG: hypothetical protein FIA99_11080 [Ruminiclostridium sp.]|nr:hypothetical protein [Ruminiclostridium sp.]
MPYRRPPQNTKRYLPPLLPFNFTSGKPPASPYQNQGYHKDFLDIPLPNEQEYASNPDIKRILPGLSSAVNFVKEHIHIEELILIGLIILLLDESTENNLLLILLFYILIF